MKSLFCCNSRANVIILVQPPSENSLSFIMPRFLKQRSKKAIRSWRFCIKLE